MSNDETFGSWLRQRRRGLDLTQQALADCAGCSRMTIRKFESDERRPSRQLALLLADCLAIPTDQQEVFVAYARQPLTAQPAPPPLPIAHSVKLPISNLQSLQSLIPPAPSLPRSPAISKLPAPLTPLIGRESEIVTATDYLINDGVRLLTLTGPGGTGKTRLAIAIGRHLWEQQRENFPDGVVFVDLAAVIDPQLVVPTIAQTFGLKEQDGESLAAAVLGFVRPRQMLLLLDNFEQVLEAAEDIFVLLREAAGLRVLVTSRALLRLYGEYELPVQPLALPDTAEDRRLSTLLDFAAIRLFVERSRAVRPGFALTAENAEAVVAICHHLDGLPLAIELAAARTRTFNPQALLSQLARSLDFTAQQRHISERQRTLRAAIEWSYRLLSAEEQRLFSWLAVFAGAFRLEDATAVCATADDQAAEDALAEQLLALVEKSMVQTREADGQLHFRLLVVLREYAREQLDQRGETAAAEERHARHFLALAQQSGSGLNSPEQLSWFQQMTAVYDDFRAALAFGLEAPGKAPLALELAVALHDYWRMGSQFSEGRRWLQQVIAANPHVPAALSASAYCAAANLAQYYGDLVDAEQWAEKSLALWRELGEAADTRDMATVLRVLGHVNQIRENFEQSIRYDEEALEVDRRRGDVHALSKALHNMGLAYEFAGKFDLARRYFEEVLPLDRQIGEPLHLAYTLNSFGTLEYLEGNYLTARALLEEALPIINNSGDNLLIAMLLANLADVDMMEGRLDDARLRCERGQQLAKVGGIPPQVAYTGLNLALWGLMTGQSAADIWPNIIEPLNIWRGMNSTRLVYRVLYAIAWLLNQNGRPQTAVHLLAHTDAQRETGLLKYRVPILEKIYSEIMTAAQIVLDEATFVAAQADGCRLSPDEALDLALSEGQAVAQASPAPAPNQLTIDNYQLPIVNASRYTIQTHLATGGMGEVYLAQDNANEQTVVIKRLRPEFVANGSEMMQRFIREGELLRNLDHPNIVKMLAAGHDERSFLVLEYVPGGTLREVISTQAPLSSGRVAALGLEIADALARAHHLGILHRDLKPENVLLAANGTPRLTDFGLAYRRHSDPRLTAPGVTVGTVAYMSPETHLGREVGTTADLWSLGVILYELLTGSHPFERPTLSATLLAILNDSPPELSHARPDVPLTLVGLLNRLLEKDPTKRLDSARQVAAELERIR